ncbi:MAG: hypothetical protein Q8Q73_07295 [Stagnimonas sp.]|nr:hypothetical protein [Stagnimonas sp.]
MLSITALRSAWGRVSSFPKAGAAAVLALAAVVGVQGQRGLTAADSGACPSGYVERDPLAVSQQLNPAYARQHQDRIRAEFGGRLCVSAQLPESSVEVALNRRDAADLRNLPAGLMRRAVEQKAALAANKASVPNADGEWEQYGSGPQLGDPAYNSANAVMGHPAVMGRVDNFAYDPEAKRLFAAVANGGIWVSEAVDGDLATLGEQWRAIGDGLPTLVTSAVAWTTAGGGRVLALTGEHTMGGNSYVGLGAYWSDDLGATWHHASGVPDGAFAFELAVDESQPGIVYAATSKGLFRSEDAGASYLNVQLPVSAECAGVETLGPCQFANFVTDVVVKKPGGTTGIDCGAEGCPVLAAVGFRAGAAPYPDGTPQSPGNGLYRSDSGRAGSFARVGAPTPTGLSPLGFAPNERIGRVELGAATGEAQDHDYVYAIVQDAVLLNGGFPLIDVDAGPLPADLGALCALLLGDIPDGGIGLNPLVLTTCELLGLVTISSTNLNGVYASSDFGDTWTRITDDLGLLANAPASGSSLVVPIPLGVGPGIQAWYNMWIKPDPTQQLAGIPTRLTFGLEELWKNRLPLPPLGLVESTPVGLDVFGTYFAGDTCFFLVGSPTLPVSIPVPVCPTYDGVINGTTTHPDQQDGIYIPDGEGGVWLFVGNDGGVYKQHSSGLLDDFVNNQWANGANQGFYTLMHYGIAVAKDGTVYYGNQDNASGKIEPDTRRQVGIWVGDGMWAAVDPDNSQTAYVATPGLSIVRTLDGGRSATSIYTSADFGTGHFLSPWMMDPLDAQHLVGAGSKVAVTTNAASDATWTTVFDLGVDEATGAAYQARSRSLDVRGAAIYVGFCGPCNLAGADAPFARGIATNVGGELPPAKGSPDGWHVAQAVGLPNRYIQNIHIDPKDPKTIYVALGGYSTARWAPPGQYLDQNPAIGTGSLYKSTDAGESFTDISGDLPQTVASAVLRRGEQLIVGTDLGVFISSDLSGRSWAPLGELPSVPVNQLVLKPDDDRQLFAGTFGRGVQLYRFKADGGSSSSSGGSSSGGSSGGASGGGGTEGRFGGSLGGLALLVLTALAGLGRRRPGRTSGR